MSEVTENTKIRMQKSIDSLKLDLSKIRTGRAHSGIFDHLTVDYYGAQTLLTQLANITVADSITINIQPYEKTMIQTIEKAIRDSDMGLNPATSGDLIRIPMPALTEERRKDLIKVLKGIAEKNKVAVRNIRRDSNEEIKDLLKKKIISEDENKSFEKNIQKITDENLTNIDKITEEKEKEILQI